MEQNVLLQLSHISKRYKTELALKDINMELHPGEIEPRRKWFYHRHYHR